MKYIFILLLLKSSFLYAYTYSSALEVSESRLQKIELTDSIYNIISNSKNNSFSVIDSNKRVQPMELIPFDFTTKSITDSKLANYYEDVEKSNKLLEKTSIPKNHIKTIFFDNENEGQSIGSIKLNFAKEEEGFGYKVRVSGSNDGLLWQYIPSVSQVYNIVKPTRRMTNDLIELNVANNFKYISILFISRDMKSELGIDSIYLDYFVKKPDYKYKTSTENNHQLENNKSVIYFDLPSNISIFGFELDVLKDSYYLNGVIQAKTKSEWLDIEEIEVYKELFAENIIKKNIKRLTKKTNYKKWRIVFTEKITDDLLAKIKISYLWSGDSIIFAADGEPPYKLLFSDEKVLKTLSLTNKDGVVETIKILDTKLVSLNKKEVLGENNTVKEMGLLKLTMLIIVFVLLLLITFKLFLLYKKMAKENSLIKD